MSFLESNSINLKLIFDLKHPYIASMSSIPVIGELSVSKKVEIATKIDLIELFLDHEEDEDCSYGVVSSGKIGRCEATFFIEPGKPHSLKYDISDYDEIDSLVSGSYEVSLKILIYAKNEENKFKAVSLNARKGLCIS